MMVLDRSAVLLPLIPEYRSPFQAILNSRIWGNQSYAITDYKSQVMDYKR